jgi:flagellar motor switch protein FliN/FliY
MTTLENPTYTDLDQATLAAAQVALAALPGTEGWSTAAVSPDGSDLLPDPGARAVVAKLGTTATLVLLAAPVLAQRVQVGPPPAEDLVEGLTPAVTAAAACLAGMVDGSALAGITESDPVAALSPEGDLAAVRLLDGEAHLATLVAQVVRADPAPEPHTEPFVPSSGNAPSAAAALISGFELLHDVEMGVAVELGRTRMLVRDVLSLSPGSVIELDRAAGAPVDVLVNGTMIARGEVVVIDEEFGVRITEIIGYRP